MREFGGYKVLLITKDVVFGRNIKTFLSNYKKSKFHVVLMTDFAKDDVVKYRDMDIALLDIGSLDDRNMSTLKKLKTLLRDVPIIAFITVPGSDRYVMDLIKNGADDYLIKENLQLNALVKSILLSIEKNRLKAELIIEEKLKGILQLAGAVCHDLNQPLQVISGYLELVFPMFEKKEYDKVMHVLKIVAEQVNHMADIVDRLSRITSYKTIRYLEEQNILDLEKASEESA